jgi:hypothetical protein
MAKKLVAIYFAKGQIQYCFSDGSERFVWATEEMMNRALKLGKKLRIPVLNGLGFIYKPRGFKYTIAW